MMPDNDTLFVSPPVPLTEQLAEGVFLHRAFCLDRAPALLEAIARIEATTPSRHLVVPGGHSMSVAMTNAGAFGWSSDRTGYRYTTHDPATGNAWLPLPELFLTLARESAARTGFEGFAPNACLINRYNVGARLSLHQDKDELDWTHPIVSVSLGLPATFLLGTLRRSETPRRIRIEHGDVMVWGGPARLIYHGVAPIRQGTHPLTGAMRINLTFRCVSAA